MIKNRIRVFIVNSYDGTKTEANIRIDVPVSELIPALAVSLRMQSEDSASWHLELGGRMPIPEETLMKARVQEGGLVLTSVNQLCHSGRSLRRPEIQAMFEVHRLKSRPKLKPVPQEGSELKLCSCRNEWL